MFATKNEDNFLRLVHSFSSTHIIILNKYVYASENGKIVKRAHIFALFKKRDG